MSTCTERRVTERGFGLLLAAIVAAVAATGPVRAGERAEALALETVLASGPDLYLVLRVEPPELEIRARGMTLDRVPVGHVAFLASRSAWGRRPPGSLALPVVWVIAEAPAGVVRRQIEPRSLEPFDPDGLARALAVPEPDAARAAEPPASYRVVLRSADPAPDEEPWTLEVTSQPPSTSIWTRPFRLLADGWWRLWGGPPPPPRVLSLTLEPEAARALHHQIQQDTRLLVLAAGG